jgi:hypothetical protein
MHPPVSSTERAAMTPVAGAAGYFLNPFAPPFRDLSDDFRGF